MREDFKASLRARHTTTFGLTALLEVRVGLGHVNVVKLVRSAKVEGGRFQRRTEVRKTCQYHHARSRASCHVQQVNDSNATWVERKNPKTKITRVQISRGSRKRLTLHPHGQYPCRRCDQSCAENLRDNEKCDCACQRKSRLWHCVLVRTACGKIAFLPCRAFTGDAFKWR